MGRNTHRLPTWVSTFVVVVVVVVWAANFLADIFLPSYSPNPLVHGIMLMVVAAVLGLNISRRSNNGSG